MTVKEFIEKAIEGGWYEGYSLVEVGKKDVRLLAPEGYAQYEFRFEEVVLDPLAWVAVGKACGWKVCKDQFHDHPLSCRTNQWCRNMHRLIDHLAAASQKPDFNLQTAIEEFLSTLT